MTALPSDKEIKRTIADKIKAIVGGDNSGKAPKVYPWNPLKPLGFSELDKRKGLQEWSGLFTYTKPDDAQTESVTISGNVSVSGNVKVTLSGIDINPTHNVLVPVINGDTLFQVAQKIRVALPGDSVVAPLFNVSGTSDQVVLEYKTAGIQDDTFNFSIDNNGTGIDNVTNSTNLILGKDNSEVQLIHGWLIKRAERISDVMGQGCEILMPAYDIWFFYGFELGTEDSNSEDTFNAIIDEVCEDFNKGDDGSLLNVNSTMLQHTGLQFPVISLIKSGEYSMHFGGGRLEFDYGD